MKIYNDKQSLVIEAENAADHFRLGRLVQRLGIATGFIYAQTDDTLHLRLPAALAFTLMEQE